MEDHAALFQQYEPPRQEPPDILIRLADLHLQATTERSHYYVASLVREAMAEIARLREQQRK